MFGFGGLPLIYMGDEWGLLNDHSYLLRDEEKADSRWVHRPYMPKFEELTEQGRDIALLLSARITRLATARKSLPQLHASQSSTVVMTSHNGLFFVVRDGDRGVLVEVYNMSPDPAVLSVDEFPCVVTPVDLISGDELDFGDQVHIPGFASWWLLPR